MLNVVSLRRVAHASPVAIALLVAANLVPLVGVLSLGWELTTLVALYWLENGVVGVFAIGRILSAQGTETVSRRGASPVAPIPPAAIQLMALARFIMVPFFLVHYGLFWVGHGVFVWVALPVMLAAAGAPVAGPDASVVMAAGVALLVSHGVSFIFNWFLAGEYRTSTPSREMMAPYARVVILHVTIVIGAFAVAILGAPIWAMVVMVVIKTVTDLSAHLAERRRAAARLGATNAGPAAGSLSDGPAAA
ncbi:MAG: DUF6498-containing protein [Candidatus Limnocylindrales bacterium]